MTVALIPTRSYLSPLMPRSGESGDVLQWWCTQSDTDFVPPWSSLPLHRCYDNTKQDDKGGAIGKLDGAGQTS
jgi:hypothetical protein